MHTTSELILRNAEAFTAAPVLLFNPPRDALAAELARAGAAAVTAFTQDFGDQQFLSRCGIHCEFGLLPGSDDLADHIVLFLPREKDRLVFLLDFLAANMPANATLWLVGENKAGIKSAESRLRQRFSRVVKRDSARHCGLYQAQHPQVAEPTKAATRDPAVSQRPEGATFSLADYQQEWTLPAANSELKFTSLPGSFAHGRLDKGTALLLEFLQSPAAKRLNIGGRVIDFGCGVGVIGLVLKRQYPDIELEMLDTSASALESARLSLQANGMEARVLAANGLDAVAGRYDWIISNPPFHTGVATNLEIAQNMVAAAPALLGHSGRMLLVCNRHLPYEGWLANSFAKQDKLAENREFKVLLAHGPRNQAHR